MRRLNFRPLLQKLELPCVVIHSRMWIHMFHGNIGIYHSVFVATVDSITQPVLPCIFYISISGSSSFISTQALNRHENFHPSHPTPFLWRFRASVCYYWYCICVVDIYVYLFCFHFRCGLKDTKLYSWSQ